MSRIRAKGGLITQRRRVTGRDGKTNLLAAAEAVQEGLDDAPDEKKEVVEKVQRAWKYGSTGPHRERYPNTGLDQRDAR